MSQEHRARETPTARRNADLISTILQTQPVRYALITLWAIGLSAATGWRTALAWFAATVAAGLVRGWAEARMAARGSERLGARFVAVALTAGCFWALAPLLAWNSANPFGRPMAMTFLAAGYFLVATQLRDKPIQALVISSPYTVATAVMAVQAWGTPLFWPFAAALPLLWTVLLVHMLLSQIMQAKLDAVSDAQGTLILQLGQARDASAAANTAKSAFLATMSHEIRTPLNGVLGMAQAMAADELSQVQRDRLSVIHRSGEALLAILNDVLDLSKIEAGKLELETIEFDLGELAQGAYSAFTALANKKGLSFALDIAQARGRYLGDPTRIRQILYNLISNALKFTDQGEIRVIARHDGTMLEIAVADTGVGISPDNLVRLFQKFDQLDSSTTRRYGGTGLGLAICHELAQLMGGEIGVESRVGEGSRFIVRLPLPMIGEERGPPQLAPAPACDLKPMRLRVLAAEDNAVNQLVLKTLLHQLGLEPIVVEDGAAAVEAWSASEWDVILMDVQMPVMDGLTAAAEIRRMERETGRRPTPIIALTANAMSHQVEQYLAAGMDGHVAKPIAAADLFQALSAVMDEPEDSAAAEVA
jgi:signal transduction histidine kinase/CheY-like chemotaxis protein